jgi:hypothetical protein
MSLAIASEPLCCIVGSYASNLRPILPEDNGDRLVDVDARAAISCAIDCELEARHAESQHSSNLGC